jgi:Domain of unknown function (DUF4202)
MSEDSPRLAQAAAAIDAANALDAHTIDVEGKREPAELVYGRRMSTTLGRISPQAPEHLRIAVRGQHIERWTSPRKAYVEGRVGYLKGRKDLQDFHARRIGEIMAAAGYGEDDIGRVGALVRKERLKSDAEAQTLEDVACLVFLAHYLDDFVAKRPIPTSSLVSWPRSGTRCRRRDAMRHSSSRCRRRSLRSSNRASPGSAETAEPTKLKFTTSAPAYSATAVRQRSRRRFVPSGGAEGRPPIIN